MKDNRAKRNLEGESITLSLVKGGINCPDLKLMIGKPQIRTHVFQNSVLGSLCSSALIVPIMYWWSFEQFLVEGL